MKLYCTKRWYKLFSVLLILLFLFQTAVSAEVPYNSYNYNAYPNSDGTTSSMPAATGYLPDQLISGTTLGTTAFSGPSDFYYDNVKYLYVLDAGNNRIVVLNKSLQLDHIVNPKDENGNDIAFQEVHGIFVDKSQRIYIADKKAAVVYILDSKGKLIHTIGAPESELFQDTGKDFEPTKVLVDNSGMIYVISDSCYYGLLEFTPDYEFVGFFGSLKVRLTGFVLSNQFWKKVLPKNMASRLADLVPTADNNFDIDSDGFIYTSKMDDNIGTQMLEDGQIRKLNYLGNNILWYKTTNNTRTYGDIQSLDPTSDKCKLEDVDVDSDGFINTIDLNRKRIFQYDPDSNLVFVIGAEDTPSDQLGTFNTPSAIESIDGNILVLDSQKNTITVLKPTYYANQVHAALKLFRNGNYVEAEGLWKDVLKYDNNNTLANIGLGKAYETEGDYQQSLQYFKTANDQNDYSDAYYHYRSTYLHTYFPEIIIGVIAVIILLLIRSAIAKKHRKNEYDLVTGVYRYPFFTMCHPFKGFTALKDDKKGSLKVSYIIVLLFFVVSIFERQNTGFLFTKTRPEDFNIIYTILSTFGVFILWVVSNWALSTLMDGEGKFTEIWIFSSYALLPFVLFMIPLTLLSQFLTLDESALYGFFKLFIYLWVFICMLMAIREVHRYTTGKTVLTLILTVLFMIFAAALVTVMYGIFVQLIEFVTLIINEIALRLI